MHKITNFTGSARHGWEKMTPSMGFGAQRGQQPQQQPQQPQPPGPPTQLQAQQQQLQQQPQDVTGVPPSSVKTRSDAAAMQRQNAPRNGPLSLSFNIPFSSNLAGPDKDDIIHATPTAFRRWTQADDSPEGTPVHKLPVHVENVDALRELCRRLTDSSEGRLQASVTSSEPRPIPGLQLGPLKALVTNVCLSGDPEVVKRTRGKILNDTPISLRCATVDIDQNLVSDPAATGIRTSVLEHINYVATWTGTDIFLLRPKQIDIETASFNGTLDNSLDQRFRVAIYGDMESAEHAKTRILIMIDQILKRKVDIFKLELSMHTMICGRLRKHIKQIESATNTAIYFPPPFPNIYGYTPPGANRRREDEIFLTGDNEEDIYHAKTKLHELARCTQACVKEIRVFPEKMDSILLERLEKIRKIMEYNGSYVLFPQLGVRGGSVRVQGTDMLHVERTIREVMSISGQFYAASWWTTLSGTQRAPTAKDVQNMLADICISSGAEISFEKLTFHIYGSDDAVKAALWIINTLPFVKKAQSHLRVKIELANEHKEFVSGKKNGKINKIMSQSNVQVYFDLFNEYNFFIDVSGQSYEATKNGLDLVEQEMPASIGFHVPDQYHKRIIGIGGQHIQRIMKKYSVFVKFSNAMDRGGASKEDDDIKVDNVICRTPARNAQSLDLVKQEIMDMVEKADAEFVTEHVIVNRLYHRELLTRMPEIEELEKKWNCKINFPSTEQASDVVSVTGPEYQVPQAIDALLGMVPESHEIIISTNDELEHFFTTDDFQTNVMERMKDQYEVDLHVIGLSNAAAADAAHETRTETLTLSYTRNNAGGLKDAIDFLTARLVAHGLDASTVRGAIPRPKSDSFEDSLPFFDSKLLHRADPTAGTDSPTRQVLSDSSSERSFFDKLRKPGSITSLSSFLDRRKNGTNSPSSTLFKHASNNASKASLISLESASSAYRNPWNDSGVNLPEEDAQGGWPARFSGQSETNNTNNTTNSNSKFSLGTQSAAAASSTSLTQSSSALPPPTSSHSNKQQPFVPGDTTPKHESQPSHDSGRPSTAQSSSSAHLAPIGPPS